MTETLRKRPCCAVAGLTALALLASACTIEKQPRGFYLDEKKVEAITPGFDSQGSVQVMMGNPSITSTFDKTTWYYISEMARRKSLSKPKAISRNIVAVHFAADGVVESVDRYTLADGRKIKPRKDTTPTRGKKLGVFEQIFSNIGRFSNTPGSQGQ
ncbi:MAG TPA: outer membrane protein assembly factor BamE [Sphingomonadales bacterium]|nr:outer membrane protein assembly factor BamE [Sphingomonadales bacterium]